MYTRTDVYDDDAIECRFGDGRIMIGFSSGYFVIISTKMEEIGQEIYQNHNHKTRLNDISHCPFTGKAATCGDDRSLLVAASMSSLCYVLSCLCHVDAGFLLLRIFSNYLGLFLLCLVVDEISIFCFRCYCCSC